MGPLILHFTFLRQPDQLCFQFHRGWGHNYSQRFVTAGSRFQFVYPIQSFFKRTKLLQSASQQIYTTLCLNPASVVLKCISVSPLSGGTLKHKRQTATTAVSQGSSDNLEGSKHKKNTSEKVFDKFLLKHNQFQEVVFLFLHRCVWVLQGVLSCLPMTHSCPHKVWPNSAAETCSIATIYTILMRHQDSCRSAVEDGRCDTNTHMHMDTSYTLLNHNNEFLNVACVYLHRFVSVC